MGSIIAPHVGREHTVEALGQTWTAGRFDLAVWDKFLSWARTQLPDPMDVAERSCLRLAAQERRLVEELAATRGDAEKAELRGRIADLQAAQTHVARIGLDKGSSYLAVSSPEVTSLLGSPRGNAKALALLLAKHHPDVTEDEASLIALDAGPEQMRDLWAAVHGKQPASPGKNGSAPAA